MTRPKRRNYSPRARANANAAMTEMARMNKMAKMIQVDKMAKMAKMAFQLAAHTTHHAPKTENQFVSNGKPFPISINLNTPFARENGK